MALDGIYLSRIKNELGQLIDSRVDKIHQPSREELIISMRTREGVKKLLFNSASGSARVHLTDAEIENPRTPPMFCMLMRKHLSGARLAAVRQEGFERILFFDFDATNEMGDKVALTLVCEIMGRVSNLILVSEQGKVIDSIKRVSQELSSVRTVLPGVMYTTPPRQDRLNFFECTAQQLSQRLALSGGSELSKALLTTFEGISPVFAREMSFACTHGSDIGANEITGSRFDDLWAYIGKIRSQLLEGTNTYTLLSTDEGVMKDFCFCDVAQYGSLMKKASFDSPCKLLDRFYTQRDAFSRTKQKAADLFKLLTNAIERTRRRTENQRLELEECANRDELRANGDMIMSNLYLIKKGDKQLTAPDIFGDSSKTVTIPLDARLSPVENAQRYYKEYRKLGAAKEKLTELVRNGEEEAQYLDSVLEALTRARSESEIAELREELAQQGYVRRQKNKTKLPPAQPPMQFVISGFTVRVGRNNKQNDKLTCKDSEKTDVWLHTKDITGSHTVISAKGESVPDDVIRTAAQLAAHFSKAKDSSQVGVDYTLIKYVKKPAGAKPGMVIFTNNKTLYVTPLSDEQAQQLKK